MKNPTKVTVSTLGALMRLAGIELVSVKHFKAT